MGEVASLIFIEIAPDRRIKDMKDFYGDYAASFHRGGVAVLTE
jgi:hypothetical protein